MRITIVLYLKKAKPLANVGRGAKSGDWSSYRTPIFLCKAWQRKYKLQ